jgi:uncharacterized protein YecT (DUF1311 family)
MLTVSPARAVDIVQACYAKANTQLELSRCGEVDQQCADRELNAVYQAVLKSHC